MTATTAMPDDVPKQLVSETYIHNENTVIHTDRLCNQLWKNIFLVVFRNRSDDSREGGLVGENMLLGDCRSDLIEVDIFLRLGRIHLRFIFLNQGVRNIGASSHVSFVLR